MLGVWWSFGLHLRKPLCVRGPLRHSEITFSDMSARTPPAWRSTAASCGGGRCFLPPPLLLWLGVAVRAALLGWGAWQDSHLAVKYTDIDYEVVTDGAAFMAAGGSPYARSTYRYTPLLAAALLPNLWLHRAWGKLLFCGADLLAAW